MESLEGLRRIMSRAREEVIRLLLLVDFKRAEKNKEMRATDQRSASHEQEAPHPPHAMEADVPSDENSCNRVCVFFPFILDFNGRTSRGYTGKR